MGDALDNALVESTVRMYTLRLHKTELIKRREPWLSLAAVDRATAERVDWYNWRRR